MGLDGKKFGQMFNSEAARETVGKKVHEAAKDPKVMEELTNSVKKLDTGSLKKLGLFLAEEREKIGANAEGWRQAVDRDHGIREILVNMVGGAGAGAAIGTVAGGQTFLGAIIGFLAGPVLAKKGEERGAASTVASIEEFVSFAPKIEQAIQEELQSRGDEGIVERGEVIA